MNWIKLCLILLFQVTLLSGQKNFSFVFLPDIHLNADSSVMADFEQLVKQINKLHPDFVLTGGDMIYTAKNVNDKKAELLFNLMDKEFGSFSMPVYKTMGNHENVGITVESGIDKTNPNWGKQMYEKRYGKRYFSFIYNGWKFLVLDGIKILDKEKNYTYCWRRGSHTFTLCPRRVSMITTAKIPTNARTMHAAKNVSPLSLADSSQ